MWNGFALHHPDIPVVSVTKKKKINAESQILTIENVNHLHHKQNLAGTHRKLCVTKVNSKTPANFKTQEFVLSV